MTSWREIVRFCKDADGFRALAAQMLAHTPEDVFTDWELTFLKEIGTKSLNTVEFTTRQSEKLLEIRDNTQLVETVGKGFSVAKLIGDCFLARSDLTEDQEEWIAALRASEAKSVRRRDAYKLLRCASGLGIIEAEGA